MDGQWEPRTQQASGLVRPVPIDPRGVTGPTRGQAGGPGWRRSSRGLYVRTGPVSFPVEQRIVEQAARGGVVTGWAGLRLHRVAFFEGTGPGGRPLPVPVVADSVRLAPDERREVSREPVEGVVLRHGVRTVSVERALFDHLRRNDLDLRERVVAADMVFAARLTSIARMRRFLSEHSAWRRASSLVGTLDLCCERSRSPQESRLRLVWVLDAGWPHPECNRPVLDLDGLHLATPDLLDVDPRVAAEFDGAVHRDRDRHRRDVAREAALRRVGLEVVTVVGADVAVPATVVARLEDAASRRTDGPPRWRLAPPTETLDDRLDAEARLRDLEL